MHTITLEKDLCGVPRKKLFSAISHNFHVTLHAMRSSMG